MQKKKENEKQPEQQQQKKNMKGTLKKMGEGMKEKQENRKGWREK